MFIFIILVGISLFVLSSASLVILVLNLDSRILNNLSPENSNSAWDILLGVFLLVMGIILVVTVTAIFVAAIFCYVKRRDEKRRQQV